jgi:hypothetical protein
MSTINIPRLQRVGAWLVWLVLMAIAFKQLFRGTVGEFSAHGDRLEAQILYSRFAYFVPFIISVFAYLLPRIAAALFVFSGAIGYWYLWRVPNSFIVENRHELLMAFLPWIGLQACLALMIFGLRRMQKATNRTLTRDD